ncbi:ATP-binding protein [Ferruginibacter yonginensis]|uniref:histidine kinase n=1 Tax=Ferruginibacter yonginensis TaxID=1310416 RepID=A0ABV8QSV8_9BACT
MKMKKAPIHSNDHLRVAALHKYDIINAMPNNIFSDLADLASIICDTPISFIAFMDEHTQHFKGSKGTDIVQASRELSFCTYAIYEKSDFFIINDTTEDERFYNHPYVVDSPYIAFYASVPIVDDEGFILGNFCVMDHKPKQLSSLQVEALKKLRNQVVIMINKKKQGKLIENTNTLFKKLYDVSEIAYQKNKDDHFATLQNFENQYNKFDDAITHKNYEVAYECLINQYEFVKQQIEALNTKIELLEDANNDAKIGAWEYDITKQSIYWSPTTKKIHGVPQSYSPNLASGINFYKEGNNRLQLINAINNAIEKGESFEIELQLITAKGDEIWVRSKGVPVFKNNKCIKLYGTFQHIDEQKKQALALQTSEQKFRGIFNSVFQFIGFLNTDGILLEANETALAFAGLQPKDVIGKHFWDCYWWQINEATKTQLKANFDKVLLGQWVEYEVAVWDANKNPQTILFNMKPLFDENNNVIAVIPEGRLIEEFVQIRKALTHKNAELEQFASVASHDLKEPLRMISNFMQLLQKNYGSVLDEKGNKYINFAVDSALRMTTLINELLIYTKTAAAYGEKTSVKTQEILADVLKLQHNVIAEKNATIIVGTLPTVNSVATGLKLVFQNLLLNALKYQLQHNQPLIEISAIPNNDDWLFAFKDNGIGIEPEYHESIFNVFNRLHTNETYTGNGLGLATCKKIITQQGGQLWVESTINEGSTFYFTIPK